MLTSVAGRVLDALSGLLVNRWRSWRYGARLSLMLDWRALIVFVDQPTTYWRVVAVSVVSAKHKEFVVASGAFGGSPRRCSALAGDRTV